MKTLRSLALCIILCLCPPTFAQTDWWRVLSGAVKAGKAMTLTDEDFAEIVQKQVELLDNPIRYVVQTANTQKDRNNSPRE